MIGRSHLRAGTASMEEIANPLLEEQEAGAINPGGVIFFTADKSLTIFNIGGTTTELQ